MSPWPRPDKVYFMATIDRSMVKIGSSSSPDERLDKYRYWSPVELEIIAVAPGSYAEEFALHRLFKDHHSHREWFYGAPEILSAAAAIKEAGSIPASLLTCVDGHIPNRRGGIKRVALDISGQVGAR